VCEYYTNPEYVTKWNSASPDWHTPHAENDLRPGGKFSYRMEAKDGSFGFDFAGVYDAVRPQEHFSYTMGDGRKVSNDFIAEGDTVTVICKFEAETQNSEEMQRFGWQSILDNFKNFTESN
jgi:uncharacterized protein YndB with AHSA1/START domain